MDLLSTLPLELVTEICVYLDAPSICNLFRTCKLMESPCGDDNLAMRWLQMQDKTVIWQAVVTASPMLNETKRRRERQYSLLTHEVNVDLMAVALSSAIQHKHSWFTDRLSEVVPMTMTMVDTAVMSTCLFGNPGQLVQMLIQVAGGVGGLNMKINALADRTPSPTPVGVVVKLLHAMPIPVVPADAPDQVPTNLLTLTLGLPVMTNVSHWRFVMGHQDGQLLLGVNPESDTWEELILSSFNRHMYSPTLCKRLIERFGSDGLNIQDIFGVPPLMTACKRGPAEFVTWLLDIPGVDVNVVSRCGMTPLKRLADNMSNEMDPLFKRVALIADVDKDAFNTLVTRANRTEDMTAQSKLVWRVRQMMPRHKCLRSKSLKASLQNMDLFEILIQAPNDDLTNVLMAELLGLARERKNTRAVHALITCAFPMTAEMKKTVCDNARADAAQLMSIVELLGM